MSGITSNGHAGQLTGSNGWQDVDENARIVESAGSPPVPEKGGLCAWLSGLLNYLSGTFGGKMSASKLNFALDTLFTKGEGWSKGPNFESGGVEQTAWRHKQASGITYVVSAPAHDLLDEQSVQAQLSGGRSAAQTLQEIKAAFPDAQVKALVPIAQSNELGCFGERGHFVLLEVNINAGKIESVQIHDSKGGLVDAFYDGAGHLTRQLRSKAALELGEEFSVTVEHRGEQSLFNGSDCGRFSAYYANEIAEHGDLSHASKAGASDFFEKRLEETRRNSR